MGDVDDSNDQCNHPSSVRDTLEMITVQAPHQHKSNVRRFTIMDGGLLFPR